MLSIVTSPIYAECRLSECRYAECRLTECRYAECRYAECRYAECRYAECRGAIFFLTNLTELSKVFFKLKQLL